MTLRLPIPLEWPIEAQRACASSIGDGLADQHGMQIIPFTLQTPNETQWARISAQVYLDRSDFEALATNALKLASTCSPHARAHPEDVQMHV
mmetsp:Transcript_18766/g.61062  ORF Transcript_18766/g.61062 Transcript_18766/m.61062 type:complete len:92 (+) Transcript_18766:58-333(+)